MSRTNSALLVIDVQERLVPSIHEHPRIIWNIGRLIDAARILSVPVEGTEQYPQGLGVTVPELRDRIPVMHTKRQFSCAECVSLFTQLKTSGISNLLLCGIETHVCVQQTALDLIGSGFQVFLAVDACGSRFPLDREIAIQRMQSMGVTLTTTESAIFEWCETSLATEFKAISQLIRQPFPGDSRAGAE